jgi:uncharacterized membrane protein YdcZ (DUF606 family)
MELIIGILGLIAVLVLGDLAARLVLPTFVSDPAHQRLVYPVIVVGVALLLCGALFVVLMYSTAD